MLIDFRLEDYRLARIPEERNGAFREDVMSHMRELNVTMVIDQQYISYDKQKYILMTITAALTAIESTRWPSIWIINESNMERIIYRNYVDQADTAKLKKASLV